VIRTNLPLLAFGEVVIDSSVNQTFWIEHQHLQDSIVIIGLPQVSVSVNGGVAFSNGVVRVPPPLAGNVLAVTLRYRPTAVGVLQDSIRIASGTAQAAVAVRGRGIATIAATTVRFLNDQFYVGNQPFFPLGWMNATGTPITLKNMPSPPIDTTTTPNARTTMPGTTVVISQINSMMDVGFGARLCETGAPCGSYEDINLQRQGVRRYLDKAQRGGLRVIIALDMFSGMRDTVGFTNMIPITLKLRLPDATITSLVQDSVIRNHPALFGWITGEEFENFYDNAYRVYVGDAGNQPPVPARFWHSQADLAALYQTIRALDPNHPVGVITWGHYRSTQTYLPRMFSNPALRYYDFLIQDIYPFQGRAGQAQSGWDSYPVLPMLVDTVHLGSGSNFSWRQYHFRQPSYLMSQNADIVQAARSNFVGLHPTASTGAMGLLSYSADNEWLYEDQWNTRAPSVAEQMYHVFSTMYYTQEQRMPRVVSPSMLLIYSYDFTSQAVRDQQHRILRFFADHNLGRVLQQSAAQTDAFAQLTAPTATDEQAVKRIVRQYGDYYYLVLINTRANGQEGVQEAFAAVSGVRVFVPDSSVIDQCEELLGYAGQANTTIALRNEPFVAALGRSRQSFALSLPAAGVRIFRLRLRQRGTTQQTAQHLEAPQARTPQAPAQDHEGEQLSEALPEKPQDFQLSLSPNPTSESLVVHCSFSTSTRARLVIVDNRGAVVGSTPEQHWHQGTHTVPLSVQHLPAGTYQCLLYTDNHSVHQHFVIIR
jgi:hypothetical protein